MRAIASAIAIIGMTVTANASFRGNRMTTYNMEHHEQPTLAHTSTMYQFEQEGAAKSQTDNTRNQISVGITYDDDTVAPPVDDPIDVGITYDDTVAPVDDPIDVGITYDTVAPTFVETVEPADDETTIPMDDDDDIITTGPMDDDDEATTAAPDVDDDEKMMDDDKMMDDEKMMDDAADTAAYILSDSGRNLQAEVVGVLPDDADDDDEIITEAPIDITTEPIDDDETTVEPIDDDEETSLAPTEEIPTVLPGGPFLPIIDIIGRPSRPPRIRTQPSTTLPPMTEAPVVVVIEEPPMTEAPVVVVIEEPVAQDPTIEEPTPEEPPTDGVQSPSDETSDESFIRFLPSWLRSSEQPSEA